MEFVTLVQVAARGRLDDSGSLFIGLTDGASQPVTRAEGAGAGTGTGAVEQQNPSATLPQQLVSVVYYRAGYAPHDYPSEAEWAARVLIERSAATKCPTVGYQLAGTKKIQQALCEPGVLERFLSGSDCALLRKCFAGMGCSV